MKPTTTPFRAATALISIGFLISGGFFVPQQAYAITVVEVGANLFAQIKNTVESTIQTALQLEQRIKSYVLDPAAWLAGNGVIQSMVRSVITDIVSGNDGGPSFITNLRDELLQTGDAQVQDVIVQLRANWAIDLPFRDTFIDQASDAAFRFTGPGAFERSTEFTLDNYTEDADACWRGDIVSAGLNCILGMSGGITNDPIGAQSVVSQRLASERTAAEQALLTEADWSGGFLSRCEEGTEAPAEGEGTETVSLSEGLGSRLGCIINFPGSAFPELLTEHLGAPLNRILQADSLQEILGGLFTQLVGNFLQDGLFEGTRPSGGGRSFLSQGTDAGDTPTGNIVDQFQDTLTRQIPSLEAYVADWQTISAAALSARNALEQCGASNSFVNAQILAASTQIARGNAAVGELRRLQAQAAEAEAANNPNELADILTQMNALDMPGGDEIADADLQATNQAEPSPGTTVYQLEQIEQNACGRGIFN